MPRQLDDRALWIIEGIRRVWNLPDGDAKEIGHPLPVAQ